MKTFITLAALLSLATAGVAQSGPSLQETAAWIDHTYNGERRGLFQQWDRDGTLEIDYLESLDITH
jgi:hypothetical protein